MSSIICRNGEPHKHGSVQEVRDCYAGRKVTATATATRTVEHVRANQYPGVCALCFKPVGEREGRLVKNDGNGNGYRVLHLAGQCPKTPEVEQDRWKRDEKRAAARTDPRDYSAVRGGYYATVNTRGTNDYDFWYVKEGRKPGYRFVKRVIGGQGPIRITGAEALRALSAILSEGVDVCGDRFADEMGKCRDCGLPLTDEDSRAARRGPICRSK
jgi:hypothetical protein